MKTRNLIDTAKAVVTALLIALVLRTVLFQPFTIPSGSMEPALRSGDYVVVSKFAYGWSRWSMPLGPPLFKGRLFGRDPARGDVVVFRLPRDTSIDYIKRVVGLPGDRVQMKGGAVFVNGAPLPSRVLGPGTDPDEPQVAVIRRWETQSGGRGYVTLDRGFSDGDDTGVFLVPEDAYFVMGDNRDNSADSRWPRQTGVGFVPAENLVGRAEVILAGWPLRPERILRKVQ